MGTNSALSLIVNAAKLAQRAQSKKIIKAAVLMPLCEIDGTLSVLYTLRNSQMGNHQGEVSFPGGRIDAGETVVEAAIRETREELGLPHLAVDVLTTLSPVMSTKGEFVMPVFGYLPNFGAQEVILAQEQRSQSEVDQVFVVDLATLLDPVSQGTDRLTYKKSHFMCPYFDGNGIPYKIWGLTGWATNNLLQEIIIPATTRS
eukprot:m.72106 g.72106  ORF g.72106 m.72106 type:complete len:202 (+) comp24427_c0_seq1:96-701(+)